MLLSYQQIVKLQDDHSVFRPYSIENVQSASYDLHIGEKVYVACSVNGSKGVLTLKDNQTFIVPANGIFMFQTKEKVNLPENIAGKLSLRMGLVRKGLIMPSQTQADPGYSNYLFGFIYNLSNEDVILTKSDHVVSIELFQLSENTHKPYTNDYNSFSFEKFVSNYVHSSLDFLNQKITKSQEQLKRATEYIRILTYVYSFIGVIVAIFIGFLSYGPYNQMKNKFEEVKENNIRLGNDIKELKEKIYQMDKEFAVQSAKSTQSIPEPKSQQSNK